MFYPYNRQVINRLIAVLIAALLILMSPISSFAAEMSLCGNENVKEPNIKAKAGLVYSVDTDEILYSKNPDKKMSPYSITKLVTVYLAINNLDMNKQVTISSNAANDIADGSTMKLVPGEKVFVKDLVYGAMIVSGNDAAMALAEAVSGSEAKFVKLMNETVKEWGCTNTHFNNPWGNKSANHYTTARDLLEISKAVFANDDIQKIITYKMYRMPKTNKSDARYMVRHTTLANKIDSGVIGGKTGFWEKSDSSVAGLYNKKQLTLIFILLGDNYKQRDKDAKAMFKFAHAKTLGYLVDRKGAKTGSVWLRNGARTRLKTELARTLRAYPMKQQASKVKAVKTYRQQLTAPIKKGTIVGRYEVYVNDKLIGSEAILSAENIEKGWFPSQFYISNTTTVLLAIAIPLAALFIALMRKRKTQKVGKH